MKDFKPVKNIRYLMNINRDAAFFKVLNAVAMPVLIGALIGVLLLPKFIGSLILGSLVGSVLWILFGDL
jgi:hypothetical protein